MNNINEGLRENFLEKVYCIKNLDNNLISGVVACGSRPIG